MTEFLVNLGLFIVNALICLALLAAVLAVWIFREKRRLRRQWEQRRE